MCGGASSMHKRRNHQGITVRHARWCVERTGGRCNCRPTYQASVWSKRDGKRLYKTFPTLAAARSWRADAHVGLRRGTLRAPSQATLNDTAAIWLRGVRDGTIGTKSGDTYKPSAIRSYSAALE